MTESECAALVVGDLIAVPEVGLLTVVANDPVAKEIRVVQNVKYIPLSGP